MIKPVKIIFLFGLICSSTLYSAIQTSISVSPLFQEIKISPGKGEKGSIYVTNFGPYDIKVEVLIENWTLEEDGSLRFIASENPSYSCKAWCSYKNTDLFIPTGKTKVFEYLISVPNNTQPGHYWTSFSFGTLPKQAENKDLDQIHLKNKILTGVFVKVGKEEFSGRINDISFLRQNKSDEIEFICENLGRFYWRTYGFIELTDKNGKKIDTFDLPEELILPGKIRTSRITLKKKLNEGQYMVKGILKLPESKIEFEKIFDVK